MCSLTFRRGNNMLNRVLTLLLVIPMFLLAGCASDIGSSSYKASEVGESTRTYQGVIIEKRIVEVKGSTSGQLAGAAGGALAGGALGSLVGGGSGQTAATVGGAALGALAGNEAAKQLSAQEAYEYTVKLNGGEIRTVVQGRDVDLAVGQKVFLQVSREGRSRIMADNSGT